MKQHPDLTEEQKTSIQTVEILVDAIEKIADLRRPKFKPAGVVAEPGAEIVLPNINKNRLNFATDEQVKDLQFRFEKLITNERQGGAF